MNKKYLLEIGLVTIIIFIGFIFWQSHKTMNQSVKTAANQRAPLPKEAKVMLDKNGFSPKEMTIKVGSAVRWVNKSGAQQTVNSDNYPTNQLHKELNFGVFSNGSSVVYTFTKPGTYGYHNQFHHEQEGKIIVEE